MRQGTYEAGGATVSETVSKTAAKTRFARHHLSGFAETRRRNGQRRRGIHRDGHDGPLARAGATGPVNQRATAAQGNDLANHGLAKSEQRSPHQIHVFGEDTKMSTNAGKTPSPLWGATVFNYGEQSLDF